jgi:hypothetical protein
VKPIDWDRVLRRLAARPLPIPGSDRVVGPVVPGVKEVPPWSVVVIGDSGDG